MLAARHVYCYIKGYLSVCQHICHPEYTYRAYHIYRHVSTLIYMDIQIGLQVYRSASRHIHTLDCIWCLQCANLSTSSLLDLHSGIFIYKHVIGHAGLLSSRASVKAIFGVCTLLWGYGGLVPPDIQL